jgi:hypothetical protein
MIATGPAARTGKVRAGRFPIASWLPAWQHEPAGRVCRKYLLGEGLKPRTRTMVERRMELNRRYHRKKKMAKLKAKFAAAKDQREKDNILHKIHILSPWWKPPVTTA